jgi:Protein of unknown function (DUF3987)
MHNHIQTPRKEGALMKTLLVVADAYYGESKLFYGKDFTILQESFLIKDDSNADEAYKLFSTYSDVIIVMDSEASTLAERVQRLARRGSFDGTILATICQSVADIPTVLLPQNAANFTVIQKPYVSWPPLPVDNERTPKAPFPMSALPKPIQEYCEAVSTSKRTPVDYVAISVLAAMAGAIGGSTKLMVKSDWEEFAVLWLALCGDPGTTKTPVIKPCFKPIRGIQSELHKRYKIKLKDYNEAKELAKKDPESETPIKPEPEYLFLVDSTQEGLIKALADNPRGGCLVSDEITSWLGSHDKYTGKGNDRPFYLSLWSSTAYSSNRKGGGNLSVELPILTVFGGLTPSSLPKLHGGQEDGFLSRFLISCPDRKPSYFNRDGVSEQAQLDYDNFIRKLYAIEPDHQDLENITPRVVVLSENALNVFETFANTVEDKKAEESTPEIFKGAWSKAPSQAARIALIIHCGRQISGEENDPYRLSEDCMDAGVEIAKYFLSHLTSLESLFHVGASKAEELRRKVISSLRKYNSNPKNNGLPTTWHHIRNGVKNIITNYDGKIDGKALEQCLEGLEATGHIKLEYPKDKAGYHLKPLVHINPRLKAQPQRKDGAA